MSTAVAFALPRALKLQSWNYRPSSFRYLHSELPPLTPVQVLQCKQVTMHGASQGTRGNLFSILVCLGAGEPKYPRNLGAVIAISSDPSMRKWFTDSFGIAAMNQLAMIEGRRSTSLAYSGFGVRLISLHAFKPAENMSSYRLNQP